MSTEPQQPDHPSGRSPHHPLPTFRAIAHALKALGTRLAQWTQPATRALLGEIAWRAPPWAGWVNRQVRDTSGKARAYVSHHPRSSGVIGMCVLMVLAGSYAGWRWYLAQPRPVETEFTVTPPGLTCYACTPPGKPNPLTIRFSRSTAPLKLSGKDIDTSGGSIRLSPAMSGIWHWNDDSTLSFQPSQDWPIATRFNVSFARRDFVPAHVRLAKYVFDFSTPAFTARISDTQFDQDPVVAGNKKVVVTLTFSHPVDSEQLQKRISLTLFEQVTDTLEEERGTTPFTVIYDKLKLNAYIHSARLAVPSKPGKLAIRIDSGLRAARGGNATDSKLLSTVDIPGLYNLHVEQMQLAVARNDRDEPSQVLVINLNHSVLERDMPQYTRAWRLPARHPNPEIQAQFEQYQHGPFNWSQQTVNNDILAAAERLPLTQIPGDLEHYELHSFHHDAEPGQYVYVEVRDGLKSFGGYVLDHSVARIFRVPEYPRELRIAQQGSLLALSGSKSLTVMTRDVQAIQVDVGRLLPRQIQHLVSQTDGTFSAPSFRSWSFNAADITERFSTTVKLPALKPGAPHYETISLSPYLAADTADRRGIFFVTVHARTLEELEHPRADEQDWREPMREPLSDGRLIVLTDIGLIAKKSLDGSQDVFVQSIHSGQPLAQVQVDVLGRNGEPIMSGVSDPEGHVHFADLRSFKHERQPLLYLARRGGDSAFLPIEDRDRRLDLSRFDVGGVDNKVDQGSLSAYLFSDRGLYRPGEQIHIGAIVRSLDWAHATEGIPLRLDVVDPRGVLIREEPFVPGPGGFSEIRQITRPSSPAGSYTISISLLRPQHAADLIGSTIVQVRDFLPDRLKMSTHFSAESAQGWVSPQGLTARIALENLFGTPAANRRVTAQMTLSPAVATFKAYPDYVFHDPQTASQGVDETLNAAVTSDAGAATFDLNLQRFARATYRLHLLTEGFEADGGRGVSSEATQLVSNMPYLVGWKADGDLGYVAREAARSAQIIAIGPTTERRAISGAKLARIEIRYVSSLIRQNNGTYKYESRRKEIALDEHDLEMPASGTRLALDTATPGSFAYVVKDSTGLQLARIDYRVAGNANLTRTLDKDAQLQITLSRQDYSPGEPIEMQIQAPYVGSGLITIERDRVYAWRWFHTTTTSSTQSIKLPQGIEGNAYIHVEFVRDPSSDEIYASPLSYAVQPFSINLDSRRNPIRLDTPAEVKPGEVLDLSYSTQHPAHIAVFAVDEGILQVARYRAPDPLGHFFQKRALEVATTQILDLILPEFRHGMLDSAAGGDSDSVMGRHLNPFGRKGDKPVVYWSGILDSDSTPRSLQYTVPDYFNGTLHVFAVAVTDAAVGVQEARTLVRGEFVLSPNAPTTVTPGDEFDVSVGVANNSGSAQISVTVQPGPALQVVGAATQQLQIAQNQESSARFRLHTLEKLGPVDIAFTASTATASAHRRIDVSVRPATPFMTSLSAGILKHGTVDVPTERELHQEYRQQRASVSLVPLSLAHGLVTYLGNYPYSCTEQLVSQAMPALLLAQRPEFGYVRAEPGADVQGLINELRVRQNEEGAYRLWPGGSEVVEFVSLYAQHFLIEAAARGERVPVGLVDSGNGYLKSVATRDGNNLADERDTAYAIYLLTRQGQVMSAEAAALRKRLEERYKETWHQDLAAAWLAASFRLMRQEHDASAAFSPLKFGDESTTDLYGLNDPMTRDGLLLYVMSRHFPERLPKLDPNALQTLAARIGHNTYHSLSAGTTLLGLDAYVQATHADMAPHLSAAEILEKGKVIHPLALPQSLMPQVAFSTRAGAVRIGNASDFSAFYLVEQSGFDRIPPRTVISQGFEILREYTDQNGRPLARINLGQSADVHLKVRSLTDRVIADVALVDLLPGGFDLVIPPVDADAAARPASYGGWHCQFCVGQANLTYADPREDRVVFYATVTPGMQEIVYRIKATNTGRYTLPPAYGEAMYDRSAVARSAAGQIVVERP